MAVRDPVGLLIEYRKLVEGYCARGIDGIHDALKAWNVGLLNDAVSLVLKARQMDPVLLDTRTGHAQVGGWNVPLIGVAAFLHTDLFLHDARRRELHYSHLGFADRLLSAYHGSTVNRGLRFRVNLVIAWIRQITFDLPALRSQLASARKEFPSEPDLAMAEGSLEEALASPRAVPDASNRGALERAEIAYRRALSLDPQFAEARLHLGYVLFRLGRVDEARRELDRAATDARESNVQYLAMLLLGGVYEHTGRRQDAVTAYQRAHGIRPTCQVAAIALAHALFGSGDRSGAAAVARDAGDPTACDDPWWSYDYGQAWKIDETMETLHRDVCR